MSSSTYIIRNYRPDDFNSYVQLHVESEKVEATRLRALSQVFSERLGRPNHLPEKDLFIVEADGKIIGYIDVIPELGIGRVVLDCLVHPEHRRKGLATELSHYASRRAKELGARVAHVNITPDNVAAKSLLAKLGFRCVSRSLELRLHFSKARLPEVEPTLMCRHLQRGEEDKLAELQNRSFASSWGFNPNTIDEIVYRTNLSDCSPKDVILASEEDKLTGYCWTTMNLEENAAIGINKGRIFMLGVDPGYRGRGIGKLVLLAGLSYLKSRGSEVVELTVDSQNKTARALYKSLGFKISSSTLWYEKALA